MAINISVQNNVEFLPGITQEGVSITPQEAMEPVLNERLIYHESKPSLKALKSSLAFHNR